MDSARSLDDSLMVSGGRRCRWLCVYICIYLLTWEPVPIFRDAMQFDILFGSLGSSIMRHYTLAAASEMMHKYVCRRA